MEHDLKIEQNDLSRILTGQKTFEIRNNDRDYQVGDVIHFLPLKSETYDVYEVAKEVCYNGKIPKYSITYITDFGLMGGFVALGIECKITSNNDE